MENIAIILGYGVFIKPNHNYQSYLESVLENILSTSFEKIIICGGYSSSEHPSLSEAESIKQLFIKLQPKLASLLILEDKSLTTPQNLEFSQKIANNQNITIYCDSVRVPKVFYLSFSLYFPKLNEKEKLAVLAKVGRELNFSQNVTMSYQNIKIIGIPFSKTIDLAAHQIISSMIEMHFIDYPDLHQQFIDYRLEKWGIK